MPLKTIPIVHRYCLKLSCSNYVGMKNVFSYTNTYVTIHQWEIHVQCWFNAVPASQLNVEHDTRERDDSIYRTHRLHATKWVNKLLSCYLVLVKKVPLVFHSPDMKLYKKRLHSYFHIVNSMYAYFEFARSWRLQLYFMSTNRFTVTKFI